MKRKPQRKPKTKKERAVALHEKHPLLSYARIAAIVGCNETLVKQAVAHHKAQRINSDRGLNPYLGAYDGPPILYEKTNLRQMRRDKDGCDRLLERLRQFHPAGHENVVAKPAARAVGLLAVHHLAALGVSGRYR